MLSVLLGQFGLDNFVGQLALLGSGQALFMPRFQGFSIAPFFQGTAALWSVWLLVIIIGVLALSVLMTVVAQGALISAAGNWFKIKRSPNINKAWHTGVAHFWRLFFVNIVKKILFFGLLWLVYAAVAGLTPFETAGYQAALVVIFSAGVFCALIISAVTIYAAGFVVIEREGVLAAFRDGWNLLRRHFLVSLELSLILLLIDAALIVFITMVAIWFFVPSFILTMVAGFTGWGGLVSVGIAVSTALLLVFLALLGSFYNTFITTAWIYAFMKMHREGVTARLFRWFGKILKKA